MKPRSPVPARLRTGRSFGFAFDFPLSFTATIDTAQLHFDIYICILHNYKLIRLWFHTTDLLKLYLLLNYDISDNHSIGQGKIKKKEKKTTSLSAGHFFCPSSSVGSPPFPGAEGSSDLVGPSPQGCCWHQLGPSRGALTDRLIMWASPVCLGVLKGAMPGECPASSPPPQRHCICFCNS